MKIKNTFTKIKNNEKLFALRNEYGYLGNSFLIPAILMLCIYIAIGHKPFGDNSVLTLDLNAQYVYFYEALREFVYGDASLLYSFSRSMGGEFMGIYAYYVASPISYIVALFPKSLLLFALLTIICVKIGLCGLSFGFYLHKQTKDVKPLNVVIFSTMYALCAYAISYQNNIMWLDGLMLLPILTYSIERLIKTGRYKLYVATLALMMMSHYYIGYMLCWYTFFCFFFSYYKDEDRSFIPENQKNTHLLRRIGKIGASTVLGIGIAAFIVAAAYYSLQFGKNEFSEPNWDFVARFDFFDLFPKLLPGSYDTVMHEGIPNIYCGVLALFMVPIYIMAKRVPSREKIFYGAFTLLFIILMIVNPFDLVMHGFQAPNCLNYRYSFIVSFLILVVAYKGFCEIEEHSAKKIFATGASLITLLLIAQKFEFPNFVLEDTEDYKFGFILNKLPFFWCVLLSIIVIFAIGAILCHLIKTDNKKRMGQILLGAVCVELFANGLVLICSLAFDVGFSSYSSYSYYFENLTPIVEMVQEKDKTFYRSEKTTHRCTNDNMALNIKGLSNSTSTLNQKVIDLSQYLGLYADCHWTQYIGSTLVTDSLFGIKYIYSNIDNEYNKESIAQNEFMDKYFDRVGETAYYYAYQNPYALGLAFGVDGAIKELETDLLFDFEIEEGLKNPFEVQNQLLNTLLGNSEEEQIEFFKPIHLTKSANISGTSGTVDGGKEYSATSYDPEDMVDFTFTVKNSGPLYVFLPSKYERSFTVFINGEQYVSNSNYSRIVFLGYREANENIKVSFRIDDKNLYFYKNTDYFYTLDMQSFEQAYAELSKSTLVTEEKSTDDHIFGTLSTFESNQTILTTIPYDEGWNVYVDGEKVEIYSVYGDSLLAFDIENAGEHEIEFRYMPKIYVISGIISLISIAIFITLIVIDVKKKKKLTPAAVTPEADEEPKTEGEN